MKNQQPQVNDKYAANILLSLDTFAWREGLPEPVLVVKGETENHCEERIIGDYGRSPQSTRKPVIYFYGEGMKARGNRAGELQFPVSHESHYGAARGPGLLFGMKAKDAEMVSVMVNVWKSDYAAFKLLSDPGMVNYAACCKRLLDGADQRPQLIAVMQWLSGKKIRIPATLKSAPDWLGLNALMRIEEAFMNHEAWAMEWPNIKKEIVSATDADILPVKFPLTVIKGKKGHVAFFENAAPFSDEGSCVWAAMDYSNPRVGIYGVQNPREVPNLNSRNLQATLRHVSEKPTIPQNEVEKTFHFPLAK